MLKIPRVMLLFEADRGAGLGIMQGVAKYSRLHNPWTFYIKPPYYGKPTGRKKSFPQFVKDWGANGIMARDFEKRKELLSLELPVILLRSTKKNPIPYASCILADRNAVGKMGAEYLLNLGLREFAFCGFHNMPWSEERGESYRKRLAEAGFHTHFYKQRKLSNEIPWRQEKSREQSFMADWLKLLPRPIGLMVANDDRGRQVIETCQILGIHVPDEIAILGADNDQLICNLTNPPLSSIAINWENAGYEAAELLDKMMSGKKWAVHEIIAQPTHVEARLSTDTLAIVEQDVAAAVRFIRQNAGQLIQVGDVVNATETSRSNLKRQFRKVLDRSILDEIRRARANQVARMLIETNLTITRIASTLGYTNPHNITKFFRRVMGMSPMAYRKKYSPK